MLSVSDRWKVTYPGAFVGVLVINGAGNPKSLPELDVLKQELERDLRALFKDKNELRSLAPITAYKKYYKRFKKTYHVLLQLESVIFKGKAIPKVSALVDAMFITELRDMLLTAGHDMDAVQAPLTLDAANGDEKYTKIDGREQTLKARDMFISDTEGVMSSVIYGPDSRTRIVPSTKHVIFTTYAPPGIGEQSVRQHLDGLERCVGIVSKSSRTEFKQVYGADQS